MKKTILLFSIILTLSLCSCVNSQTANTQSTTSNQQTTTDSVSEPTSVPATEQPKQKNKGTVCFSKFRTMQCSYNDAGCNGRTTFIGGSTTRRNYHIRMCIQFARYCKPYNCTSRSVNKCNRRNKCTNDI